jgi:hypothetical protein
MGLAALLGLVILVVALAIGFGFAALVTWALATLGVLTFSWVKAAAVWIVLIALTAVFKQGSKSVS